MVIVVILFLLFLAVIKCVSNKIAILSLLLFLEENYHVPDENEIKKYTKRAAKRMFHVHTRD